MKSCTKIPLGPWAKDKILKEAGRLHYAHWKAALGGLGDVSAYPLWGTGAVDKG